ncbi:hypothetical protein PVAP13_6KG091835 [Panicum virgatum]|uniref:Uncharacterized protein n=1 Tax=Panicum virgatum TaxID=38727 RepID=A0A8T0R8R4_PANVG|nr:hypothetical protein PVAP13_6KG091835 [Panicum virgatum]
MQIAVAGERRCKYALPLSSNANCRLFPHHTDSSAARVHAPMGEAADPAPAAASGRVAPPMPWRTRGPDPPAAAARPPRAVAARPPRAVAARPPRASRGSAAELPRAAAGEGRARGRWRERRGGGARGRWRERRGAAVTELAGRHGDEGGRARRPPWRGGRESSPAAMERREGEREKGAGGGERVEDGTARLGPSAVVARGRARLSWRAAERARRGRPWGARAAEPAVGGGGGELGRGRRPACRRGRNRGGEKAVPLRARLFHPAAAAGSQEEGRRARARAPPSSLARARSAGPAAAGPPWPPREGAWRRGRQGREHGGGPPRCARRPAAGAQEPRRAQAAPAGAQATRAELRHRVEREGREQGREEEGHAGGRKSRGGCDGTERQRTLASSCPRLVLTRAREERPSGCFCLCLRVLEMRFLRHCCIHCRPEANSVCLSKMHIHC